MHTSDTIASLSSAVGPAARMIVRVSGPLAASLASELAGAVDPTTGASRVALSFAGLRVPAWLYVFRAPRSYTGDDLVEFHLPGSPVLARMLLDHLRRAGARDAGPGEFTARAFFNGRIGLTEAEGVAATIAANNDNELAAARQLMAGELSRRVRPALDLAAETLALVEAGIDFSDEGVTFVSPDDFRARLDRLAEMLRALTSDSAHFEQLAHEPGVVLVGRPNAGKSTLLNALAGRPRAVVSPVAGTTRDALSAEVALDRGIVRMTDVAGLDDESPPGGDEIARQMRERALRAAQAADLVVLDRDITDSRPPLDIRRPYALTVLTKSDLLPAAPETTDDAVPVSAATGWNLNVLRAELSAAAYSRVRGPATLSLNARHRDALSEAGAALARAAALPPDAPQEVAALELREAVDALGRVVGAVTPDDLLGRIFSSFCIGK
jgi:tRNA modification GTPase